MKEHAGDRTIAQLDALAAIMADKPDAVTMKVVVLIGSLAIAQQLQGIRRQLAAITDVMERGEDA